MKYTENELYHFVWRADSYEMIAIAESWIKRNVKDNDLFNDLMTELSTKRRQMCAVENGMPNWY